MDDASERQITRRRTSDDRSSNSEHNVDVFASLTPLVYQQQGRLGKRYSRAGRLSAQAPPLALINEVVESVRSSKLMDRRHFFASCARQMRRALVAHATRMRMNKVGEDHADGVELVVDETIIVGFDILQLDQLLNQHERLDKVASMVFELHYFGGHAIKDIASITRTSEVSVRRDLRIARAWLLARWTASV
jgi:RNA polymerase sigma-70 factor (ECF subfamily)